MRLALISLSIEDDTGRGPIGLLPLFDGNIIEKQVESAQKMGAEKIILLSPKMHVGLLRCFDALKARNIDVEIIRDAAELGQFALPEDDLIFLNDGVFPGEGIEKYLEHEQGEFIYVVANADIYADFERIDLNHRWLGIALLKASRLDEISQIPEEWDIGSALLRTAVQSDCERKLVTDADMQKDAVLQLLDSDLSASYAHRQLGNMHIPGQNFLDRYIVWPAMRRAMPLLWEAHDAKRYASMASIMCAAIALGFAFIDWNIVSPIISLVFLLIGALTLLLHRRISIFSFQHSNRRMTGPVFYALGATALAVNVIRNAPAESLFADVTLLAILLGNLWIIQTGNDYGRLNWMRPDVVLILGIFLVAGASGLLSIGLYSSALLCTSFLMVTQSRRLSSHS
ncbi:hypothetical protein AB1K62_02565 [Parasphingorhabdus sp. JC815]|uniref:hypothetical protein n=1 Tax=Parasphingorhabdus sp. JC815 TaxID=3232140 RepID=UPI00345A2385